MVNKAEARGYRLASLVTSYIGDITSSRKREDYYEEVRKIVNEYKFYSSKEVRKNHGGIHPRSMKKSPPQLIKICHHNSKDMGMFASQVLEDGLSAHSSEGARKYFLKYLDEFYEEIR